jgi:hypothetical protein
VLSAGPSTASRFFDPGTGVAERLPKHLGTAALPVATPEKPKTMGRSPRICCSGRCIELCVPGRLSWGFQAATAGLLRFPCHPRTGGGASNHFVHITMGDQIPERDGPRPRMRD